MPTLAKRPASRTAKVVVRRGPKTRKKLVRFDYGGRDVVATFDKSTQEIHYRPVRCRGARVLRVKLDTLYDCAKRGIPLEWVYVGKPSAVVGGLAQVDWCLKETLRG